MFHKLFVSSTSMFLALSVYATADAATTIGFKMISQTAPSAAANGYYFTYSVLVESDDEPLTELIKRVNLQGQFESTSGEILTSTGGKWSFLYSDRRGLLQFLFYVPSTQPAGVYEFTGHLTVQNRDSTESVFLPLPSRQLTIDGPRPPYFMDGPSASD